MFARSNARPAWSRRCGFESSALVIQSVCATPKERQVHPVGPLLDLLPGSPWPLVLHGPVLDACRRALVEPDAQPLGQTSCPRHPLALADGLGAPHAVSGPLSTALAGTRARRDGSLVPARGVLVDHALLLPSAGDLPQSRLVYRAPGEPPGWPGMPPGSPGLLRRPWGEMSAMWSLLVRNATYRSPEKPAGVTTPMGSQPSTLGGQKRRNTTTRDENPSRVIQLAGLGQVVTKPGHL